MFLFRVGNLVGDLSRIISILLFGSSRLGRYFIRYKTVDII